MLHKLKARIKYITLGVGLLFGFATIMTLPAATSFAQDNTDLDIRRSVNCGSGGGSGNNISLGSNCSRPNAAGDRLEKLISNIINVISAIVGAVAVIMIIIGGFKYVTSGGDSNSVSGAKNTILYAIVGLVIVAFAQIIVRFVLQRI